MLAAIDLAWRLAVLTSLVFLPTGPVLEALPEWANPELAHGLNVLLTGTLVGRWCWRHARFGP
ncbi:MAG: hypothetical protein WD009_10655 [Phycisphaeraceae bacterium]